MNGLNEGGIAVVDVQPITQIKSYEEVVPQQTRVTNSENLMKKIKDNPEYIPNVSERAIIKAIEEANKKITGTNTAFEISIHEKTKEIIVRVLNSDTKEIIREIPSEKILDMVASMCEAAGLFVDEKR